MKQLWQMQKVKNLQAEGVNDVFFMSTIAKPIHHLAIELVTVKLAICFLKANT